MLSRVLGRYAPLSVAVLTAVALTGCGSGTTGTATAQLSTVGSTTGAPATTTANFSLIPNRPAASARGIRDKLLALAKPGTPITTQGTVPDWPPANGSGIPATPTDLSGFGFVVDKPKNMQYLSFAVKDSSGKCAGGDIVANSAGTAITGGQAISVPAKAPCTGDEVAKLAGHLS